MFYHQKVAWVRVFADIQNFALNAHRVHGIPCISHLVLFGSSEVCVAPPQMSQSYLHIYLDQTSL